MQPQRAFYFQGIEYSGLQPAYPSPERLQRLWYLDAWVALPSRLLGTAPWLGACWLPRGMPMREPQREGGLLVFAISRVRDLAERREVVGEIFPGDQREDRATLFLTFMSSAWWRLQLP